LFNLYTHVQLGVQMYKKLTFLQISGTFVHFNYTNINFSMINC